MPGSPTRRIRPSPMARARRRTALSRRRRRPAPPSHDRPRRSSRSCVDGASLLPQVVEDEGVDLPRPVPFLEVLGADPSCKRIAESLLWRVAEPLERGGHLTLELRVDVDQGFWIGAAEVQVVQFDQSIELDNRRRMVIHPEIDKNIEATTIGGALTPDPDCG